MYHLRKGVYSNWFGQILKDDILASEAEKIERQENILAKESKRLIKEIVNQHYTGS
ncbi:MAG: hypothetical protein Q8858_11575 [Bacteroidota bacterium]|nr:hypothetical protein [Bacteroidota bacterium]